MIDLPLEAGPRASTFIQYYISATDTNYYTINNIEKKMFEVKHPIICYTTNTSAVRDTDEPGFFLLRSGYHDGYLNSQMIPSTRPPTVYPSTCDSHRSESNRFYEENRAFQSYGVSSNFPRVYVTANVRPRNPIVFNRDVYARTDCG